MPPPDDPRTTEALTAPAAPRALIRECRLAIVAGPRAGAEHVFAAERIVIGADPRADVVIDDAAMSRFHCELRLADGRVVVRDLGSRNGTVVDRVPVVEAPLRDGAVLALGRSELRFSYGNREVELALSRREQFGRMRGGSIPMRAAYAVLEAAAASQGTVLIQGESGTGKELAAEAIHAEGARRDGPFVVVDCGAIPSGLLEAELFGHEAGAFTGATTARVGAFEAAAGGTVFLDELGELALELQPKLLRVLDRHEIQRVGGVHRVPVDVRVIAATNRDLKAEVNAGRFRADLYFRIAVLTVTLPPLRERLTDVPVLVDAIVDALGARDSEIARALRGGALLPELLRHSWPGNVRELKNYVEACVARQERALEPVATAEPAIDITQPLRLVRERWTRHVERRYLEQVLAAHGGNVSAAARAAGVDRVHFHRLLVRAGLR
jgi:transcriptional regulator with GAF, ATPase, and Fis domain